MPDLALDLRFLKYAMLAAEHGSFRRVAEVLDLSQSTISRRIVLLERRLGVVLFERRRSGVSLTPAGRRFIDEAGIGVSHLREAIASLQQACTGRTGELSIGLMTSLASGFLSDVLAAFQRRYPNVDIKLEEGTSQSVAAAVLAGRLDVAFLPGQPSMPGCESVRLWDEPTYIVLPKGHPLADKSSLDLLMCRDELFLVTAEAAGPEIESYLIRHLSSQGYRPRISVQRVGRENLMNMVAKGFGISLTTISTLGAMYSGVLFLPVRNPPEIISSSVVWSRSNQNPARKILLNLALSSRRSTGPVDAIIDQDSALPLRNRDRSQ